MDTTEIAYHESGHAIIAAALGILRNDSRITVVPSKDPSGVAVTGSVSISSAEGFHDSGKPWSKRYVRNLVVAIYAGPVVSKKLHPSVNLLEEGSYYEFDMLGATGLKARFLVPTGCSWPWEYAALYAEERTWQKAVALVELHWPAINALAKELLKRGTTTGTEAKAILKKRRAAVAPPVFSTRKNTRR